MIFRLANASRTSSPSACTVAFRPSAFATSSDTSRQVPSSALRAATVLSAPVLIGVLVNGAPIQAEARTHEPTASSAAHRLPPAANPVDTTPRMTVVSAKGRAVGWFSVIVGSSSADLPHLYP